MPLEMLRRHFGHAGWTRLTLARLIYPIAEIRSTRRREAMAWRRAKPRATGDKRSRSAVVTRVLQKLASRCRIATLVKHWFVVAKCQRNHDGLGRISHIIRLLEGQT